MKKSCTCILSVQSKVLFAECNLECVSERARVVGWNKKAVLAMRNEFWDVTDSSA